MDSVENDSNVEGLTSTGCLAILGASAAAEVKVLMDFGSSITTMSREVVQSLRGQPGITSTS